MRMWSPAAELAKPEPSVTPHRPPGPHQRDGGQHIGGMHAVVAAESEQRGTLERMADEDPRRGDRQRDGDDRGISIPR